MDYEYLNACKVQSGLTNKAIALSKNLSESTVSRFFHGEIKTPDIPLAKAICDAIGASMDRACGLVKPIDTALTEPAPNLAAVATELLTNTNLSPLIDGKQVAKEVVKGIENSPLVSDPIDPKELARLIVDMLPQKNCDSCRTCRLYESTVSILAKAVGAIGVFLAVLLAIQLFCK